MTLRNDVPRPLRNGLWATPFQDVDAEREKCASRAEICVCQNIVVNVSKRLKTLFLELFQYCKYIPDRVSQSVTCLATDASMTADPGVASSIPARSHTFVEIDHLISSTVILLPSAESFKKSCCQLQAKTCARGTG